MPKKTAAATALALVLASGQATAGGMAPPVMEAEIVEETRQGSQAGILVPILALIFFGLAVSNNSGE
jgi:hypothetical protein